MTTRYPLFPKAALVMAIEHIKHMAAFISEGKTETAYSFEALGEDMPDLEAAASTSDPEAAEQFIQAAIDQAPEPLRRLGKMLADLLDEDQFNAAEKLLLGAAAAIPAGYYVGQSAGQILDHIHGRFEISAAAHDVFFERKRQALDEGWTPEHDDQYEDGQLSDAAGCYAISAGAKELPATDLHPLLKNWWPWGRDWWKPTDRRRDLVKAGALIIAEIERLDRANLKEISA